MKNEKTYDYMFSSFADAIIIGTLLVSIGRYVSQYYFVYIIIATVLLLIGLEGYKYLTNQDPPSPSLKVVEEFSRLAPPKTKQRSSKSSAFQLISSKKQREHSSGMI